MQPEKRAHRPVDSGTSGEYNALISPKTPTVNIFKDNKTDKKKKPVSYPHTLLEEGLPQSGSMVRDKSASSFKRFTSVTKPVHLGSEKDYPIKRPASSLIKKEIENKSSNGFSVHEVEKRIDARRERTSQLGTQRSGKKNFQADSIAKEDGFISLA